MRGEEKDQRGEGKYWTRQERGNWERGRREKDVGEGKFRKRYENGSGREAGSVVLGR